MITKEAISNLYLSLLSNVNIPPLPAEVQTGLNTFLELINSAVSVIGFFVPYQLIVVFLGVIVVAEIAVEVYHFVMWVIRKIPFLSMS